MEKGLEIPALNKIREARLTSHDWNQEAMNFVPLQGCWFPQAKDGFDLDEEINKFLSSDKKVLLLLGNSGSGKSLYTQGLAYQLCQSYHDQKPIPLWISLPSLKNPQQNIVQDYLQSFGLTETDIDTLKKTRSFIFILDGYDEIRILKNLYITNNFSDWPGKVIITCRQEYLYCVDNYKQYFVPFREEKALYNDYEEIIVRPFTHHQIQDYLEKYTKHHETEWKDWKRYEQEIEIIPGLKNLITTPFMLKLAVEALPEIVVQYQQSENKKHTLKQAFLYDIFIEQWFSRQEQKLKESKLISENEDIKPEFWDYARKLAQTMHEKGVTQITYEASGESDLFEEVKTENPWKAFFNSDDPRIALLQTACLIRKVNINLYAFIHDSFLEYFLTRNLFESLSCDHKIIETNNSLEKSMSFIEPNYSKEQDYFNQRLLVEEYTLIQMLADRIEQESFKKTLFDCVYASKNNAGRSIAASNAITILNTAGVSFFHEDFSDINIPQANLSGALLGNTNLKRANLSNVSFESAFLREANFSEARVDGARFGDGLFLDVKYSIYGCALSPDMEKIAVIADTIKIYDVKTQSLIHDITESQGYYWTSIAWDKKGAFLATGTMGGLSVHIWDTQSYKKLQAFLIYDVDLISVTKGLDSDGHPSISWSENSKFLASGGYDGAVCILDVQAQKILKYLRGHEGMVTSVTFDKSSAGRHLASSTTYGDKTVRIWNLENGDEIQSFKSTKEIECIAWDEASERLAVADGTFIKIFKVNTGEELLCINGNSLIHVVVWDVLSKRIASGNGGGTVHIWDAYTGKQLDCYSGDTIAVRSLAWDSKSKNELLISGGYDGKIHFWNTQRKIYRRLEGHISYIRLISLSNCGNYLISSGLDKKIILWDVKNEKYLTHLVENKLLACLAFDREKLAYSNRRDNYNKLDPCVLMILDIFTKKIFYNHIAPSYIKSLAWSLEGDYLAYGDEDGHIYILETKEWQIVKCLKASELSINSIAWNADGRHLAAGGDDQFLRIWDVQLGKDVHSIQSNKIIDISWSNQNKKLALIVENSENHDTYIHLCDIENKWNVFFPHKWGDSPKCITWATIFDEQECLISGDYSGKIMLWEDSGESVLLMDTKEPIQKIIYKMFNQKQYLFVASGKSINKFFLQEDYLLPKLQWMISGTPYLNLENVNFENAIGLDEATDALLKQHKTANESSKTKMSTLADVVNFQTFLDSGNENYDLGRYEEAITDYDKALELHTSDDCFNFRGNAKSKLGRYEEAIVDYSAAICLNPENAVYFQSRGNAKRDLNQYTEAIEDCNEAIRLDPKEALYFSDRANVKSNIGRYAEAIQDYDAAIQLNPEETMYFSNRADAKSNLGLYDEAIIDLDKTLEKNPDDLMVLNNKAFCFLFQNKTSFAKELFHAVLKFDNTDEDTLRMGKYAAVGMHLLEWLENDSELIVTNFFNNFYSSLTTNYRKIYLSCELLSVFFINSVELKLIENTDKIKKSFHAILPCMLQVIKDCPEEWKPKYYLAKLFLLAGEIDIVRHLLSACLKILPENSPAKNLFDKLFACSDFPAYFSLESAETIKYRTILLQEKEQQKGEMKLKGKSIEFNPSVDMQLLEKHSQESGMEKYIIAKDTTHLQQLLIAIHKKALHDHEFSKEQYIYYQGGEQRVLIKTDMSRKPYQFYVNDVMGRALTKAVDDVIAEFLWGECGERENYMIEQNERAIALNPKDQDAHHNLACYYHIKAIAESDFDLLIKADNTFQKALALGFHSGICTEYANFLFATTRYEEAIKLSIQGIQLKNDDKELNYSEAEIHVIPEELIVEIITRGNIKIRAIIFAHYLLIYSYKKTNQLNNAIELLPNYLEDVQNNPEAIHYSFFGYSCKTLGLFNQAYLCFMQAFKIDNDYRLAEINMHECEKLAKKDEKIISLINKEYNDIDKKLKKEIKLCSPQDVGEDDQELQAAIKFSLTSPLDKLQETPLTAHDWKQEEINFMSGRHLNSEPSETYSEDEELQATIKLSSSLNNASSLGNLYEAHGLLGKSSIINAFNESTPNAISQNIEISIKGIDENGLSAFPESLESQTNDECTAKRRGMK